MADIIGSLIGGVGGLGPGNTIGAAIVKLRLDSDDYNKQMDAAHGKTSAFASVAKAGFVALGAAAVAGLAVAIKAGSDLNEQLNKTREVFGGSSKAVIAFSETTAKSLGIAQVEALEAAGNFGQLFDAAGLSSQAAADMSQKMVTLSADLGSFNNIPVAEALEKIRSGLAGEAEPLRQVGVFLSEARVEQEAYTSGLAEAGEELTDAQKIQARYNIILQDTTKAQGDFGRTVGESIPNQLKVLKAELLDLAAGFGRELLPIVLDVVKAFHLLVPVLRGVLDNLGPIVAGFAAFAAFKYLPELLLGIAAGLEKIGAASLASGFLSMGAAVNSIAVAFTAAAPAAAAFGVAFAGMTAAVAAWDPLGLAGDVDALRQSMEVNTKAFGESDIVLGRVAVSSNLVAEDFRTTKQAADDQAQALELNARRGEFMTQRLAELGITTDETGRKIRSFAGMTGETLKTWKHDVKDSFDTFVLSLEEGAEQTKITRHEFMDATRVMQREAQQLNAALIRISKEKWVNDDYIKFLSEQGPEWLIGFANLTKEQQKRAQDAWEETKTKTDDAKHGFDQLTKSLEHFNKNETHHKVVIEYDYVGFDPSKPGMSGPGRTGRGGQQ